MLSTLFTCGGMHAHACALAQLTGVDMKMLPIPNIEGADILESHPSITEDMRRLYRFSPKEYKEIGAIWQGEALNGSGSLKAMDGPPTDGPHCQQEGVAFIPDYHPKEIFEVAQKLYAKAR